MIKILQSLMPLIQSQIRQSVVNLQLRLRKMFGLLMSMEKIPSHLKGHLINSSAIRLDVENPSSRSVYVEVRATRG